MTTIYTGSVLDELPEPDGGGKYHAVLCDPPYELGFMGKKWDSSGIAFDPKTWAGIKNALHPGAFGLAFAGSRGWHRMATAIEDAGFRIHPTIFCWVSGSGFPKGTRIDDQIDKLQGAKQPVIGKMSQFFLPRSPGEIFTDGKGGPTRTMGGGWQNNPDLTEPVTPEARAFAGHRYGLQALKPSVEPIIMFQKPYDGKPVMNMMMTGAGALNIEGSRIGSDPIQTRGRGPEHTAGRTIGANWSGDVPDAEHIGRVAANFVITHNPECTVDKCVCDASDIPDEKRKFFHQSHFHYEVFEGIDDAARIKYIAKANDKERDAGLDDLPIQLRRNALTTHNGTGDYRGVDKKPLAQGKNPHPTVKPVALTKWLATLLLPPDIYAPRRVLVPFSGVGSEMIGAQLAGWEDVVGVELQEEYAAIAAKRLAWWEMIAQQLGSSEVERISRYAMKSEAEKGISPLNDLPLFANQYETPPNEE